MNLKNLENKTKKELIEIINNQYHLANAVDAKDEEIVKLNNELAESNKKLNELNKKVVELEVLEKQNQELAQRFIKVVKALENAMFALNNYSKISKTNIEMQIQNNEMFTVLHDKVAQEVMQLNQELQTQKERQGNK
ncbi:MAG: hypothetical protein QM266_08115 [Bacillota bacterium]|nr:hypothetical protein [Bacillota bacterium]